MVELIRAWAPTAIARTVVVAPAFDLPAVAAAAAVATGTLSPAAVSQMSPRRTSAATATANTVVPSPPPPTLRAACGLPGESRLLLLVAGLRPVKDILYLWPALVEWHALDPRIHLVVVGPVLDAGYAAQVHAAIAAHPAVGTILPAVPPATLLLWLSQADLCLNTSVSEGQSNVLMEAMALGTPCVVRDNPGNASLIRHGQTGFRFATPAEAVQYAQQLLDDAHADTRALMVASARTFIESFSSAVEARTYRALFDECVHVGTKVTDSP